MRVAVAEELADPDLVTRAQARRLWPRIDTAVSVVPAGGIVCIDLNGARRVGVAFLDALLQMLAAARERQPGRFSVLQVDDTDTGIIDGLEYISGRTKTPVILVLQSGVLSFIGRPTKAQSETLDLFAAGSEVTSADVARGFGIRPSAASNRLNALYQLGLIARREVGLTRRGGRRFVYVPISEGAL